MDSLGSVTHLLTHLFYGESLAHRLARVSNSVLTFSSSPTFSEVRGLSNLVGFKSLLNLTNSTTESTFNVNRAPEYSSSTLSLNSSSSSLKHVLNESTEDQRFMRNMNPVFKYDFKVGNYMPDDLKKMNPHLFMTIKDVTTGIRKSAWFFSPDYSRLLQSNIATHLLYFKSNFLSSNDRSTLTALNSELDSTFVLNSNHSTNVTFTGGFYNFFIIMSDHSNSMNARWLAVNTLNQKFYKMFSTGSMQQRIHAN